MAAYKLFAQSVIRAADGAFIPYAAGNRDWQEYQAWLALGNTPDPQDPPAPPTQDELDIIAAKAYAKLTAMKAMTPAQLQTWVAANVLTLADARDALLTLAIAVSILARRL